MGGIYVGTASWTHRSLVGSGWYPARVRTPAERLAWYAGRFPVVEVDSSYYAPPAESTVRGWAERSPAGFTFHVKAFSLLTGHPTRPAALYRDLRPETAKRSIYPRDLPAAGYEEVWRRFLGVLDPLDRAGKLGVILFQYPPWFGPGRASRERILDAARRCAPRRIAVELRNAAWFAGPAATARTLDFLRAHGLPYVVVDMPQGHPSSVPPVPEATADLAYVRMHGRSSAWTSGDIESKFAYHYSRDELAGWLPRLDALAGRARQTHVLFNNCCADNSQRNAADLVELLGPRAAVAPRG